MSTNPSHGEVYSIQHHVMKFFCNLQQVSGFLWVSLETNKADRRDIIELFLTAVLNSITLT